MIDEQNPIQKYINEKIELQKLVLQIIEKTDIVGESDFQTLMDFLYSNQYEGNKPELEHFLHLILNIANNHQRNPNFFDKIEKILLITSKIYKPILSDEELFTIFKQNKPIILSLLKTKLITFDEKIFKHLLDFIELKESEVFYYFYPELKTFIKSGAIKEIEDKYLHINLNGHIENFETNRQQFENELKLCSIIREDLIEDFIPYVHKTNISLNGKIKRSIFETNSMFIENDPTIIEYAAFFGSIQIMKYLEINGVELHSPIWLYAVHSNNPEVIQFLEDKQIEMDDRTFSEAIKCHHNDIAHYIYENHFNDKDLSDQDVLIIYSSSNYEFFSDEIDGDKIFFSLCQNEYYNLIDLYLASKKEEIEN